MNIFTRNFLLYVLEYLVGTVIGFILYKSYPSIGAWCLFSILLVLSPDRKDAMNLAMNRIKANLIGAGIGLALFAIHPINLAMICIGIAAALVVCEWFKLQAVNRSAMIAVLIITMHEPGQHFWDVAVQRAAGVVLGCLVGVILTYCFHHIISRIKKFNL
jgi:uncharacterized membrane protein YgaE (UPF0421/DUF939 family)